ncbi:MAG: hypothetical protein HS122_07805 [Opitutaceae bacterium]|nr:hypothetical protein [Opitutaceae bacterium]
MFATASFDLFDTLLVRPLADPHDVFRLVERDLAAPGWALARIQAERAARADKLSREVNLDEIYSAAPLNPWRAELERFRARELEWEETMCLDSAAVERVTAARAQGARILYITDMYLPRDFLLARLAPIWIADDTLLFSHEAGDSKGRTWWATLSKAYAKPWLHIGDNPRSDVVNPARYGIETEHWTRAHPNRLEHAYLRDNPAQPLAAGLPRFARLARPAGANAFWDDGANISGPVFHAYATWLLQDARKRGITRVFFLSRDGQLPEKIACKLRAADPTLPETRYLFGSRFAWYLAAFDPAIPDHRRWLHFIEDPSINGLFRNLNLDPSDLESNLNALGFPRSNWSAPLAPRVRARLLELLSQDPQASDYFARHRQRRLALALGYLQEQGAFAHDRIALVDIGWSGTMHEAFVRLLAQGPRPPGRTIGYFFGLHRNVSEDRLFFHIRPGLWLGPVGAFPSVVEMLVPADHGQTIGYACDQTGFEPVLASDCVAPPRDSADLHAGALAYVDLAIRLGAPPPRFDHALRTFLVHPAAAQVERWKQFNFWTWPEPPTTTPPSLIPVFHLPQLLKRMLSPWRRVDLWPWPTASLRASCPRAPGVLLELLVWKMQVDRCVWIGLQRCSRAIRSLKRLLKPVR